MITVRDPIYRLINIEDEFLPFVNHPFMQRLRFIKQNALLYFVYPSAKHDRFTHSLGTYHLASIVANNERIKNMFTSEELRAFKVASLLHDVGHGPYSHLWEVVDPDFDHERMTIRIVREVFKEELAAKIIEKSHPLSKILSSVVDIDKLDYMARDSYFCGVGYGVTDVDRIVEELFLKDGKLCASPKIVSSIEHVITGRISLYKSTYFHHSVRSTDALFRSILQRAKTLLHEKNSSIYADELLLRCLDGKYDLNDFLLLDDSFIEYHLSRWRRCTDDILSDLVNRFYTRFAFSAVDEREFAISSEEVRLAVENKGLDPSYYFFEDCVFKGVYESELFLEMPNDSLLPLSEFSDYVKHITKVPIKMHYFIGPRELISDLKKQYS